MTSVATSMTEFHPLDDVQFERWVRLLELRTGVVVAPERRAFLESGLRRRMSEAGFDGFDAYYEELQDGARGAMEWAVLVDHLTVHETHFFRHPASFELIGSRWLPAWIERTEPGHLLHVLSLGCSTGEEAWSLAFLIDRVLGAAGGERRFGITATDVSKAALSVAREATYRLQALHEIPALYHDQIEILPDKDHFRIDEGLRRRVGFACVNLLHATRAPLRKLDLIFCQNVLIYFAREKRQEILAALVQLLQPGGLLVLGPGEVPGWTHPELKRVEDRKVLAYHKKEESQS